MSRNNFPFYEEFDKVLDSLSDDMRLHIQDAIRKYGLHEEEIELTSPLEQTIWNYIKPTLKKNWAQYRNACKGGAKKGSSNNPNGRRGKTNPNVDWVSSETNPKLTQNLPKTNPELTQMPVGLVNSTSYNNKNINREKYNKESIDNILTISDDIVRSKEYISVSASSTNVDSASTVSDSELTDDVEGVTTKILRDIQDLFNKAIKENNSAIRPIKAIKSRRQTLLIARIKEYGLDDVKEALVRATKSDFLNGRVTSWQASFDWLVLPTNFAKVIEGNYDSTNNQQYGNDNRQRNNIGTSERTAEARNREVYEQILANFESEANEL